MDKTNASADAIRSVAEEYSLPVKVVYRLVSLGVIRHPLGNDDHIFLSKLRLIWGQAWFLRVQLSRLSRKQRGQFLLTRPELAEKWERWIYSQYMESKIERGTGNRMLTPERMIRIDRLIEGLEDVFGIVVTPRVVLRIKAIRAMAQRDKAKKKAAASSAAAKETPPPEFDHIALVEALYPTNGDD